ncbi:MAG: hypothetical protein ACREX3_00030 [Gammaproteobacteria bacterium]
MMRVSLETAWCPLALPGIIMSEPERWVKVWLLLVISIGEA